MFESSVGQEHLPAEKVVVCVDVQGVFEILTLSSITSWCERNFWRFGAWRKWTKSRTITGSDLELRLQIWSTQMYQSRVCYRKIVIT